MCGRERRRRRRGGIRARTTIAATLVVGAALTVTAVVVVVVVDRTLTDQVRAAARLRADDIAALLDAGTPPVAIPADTDDDDVVFQVLDAGGTVVAASPELRDATTEPIATLRADGTRRIDQLPGDDDPWMLAARAAGPDATYLVIAGRPLDDVDEIRAALGTVFALAGPALLVLVAATTWLVTGRALAPVRAIRREVDAISARELHRRVPEPATDDEVARLARTMNTMLDRLERSHRRLDRFVGDASHELRSPIAALRQHAEVAQSHPDRTTVPALADAVLSEGRRLQQLVDDMLLLARGDGGRHDTRPVDLDDIVLAVVRDAATVADVTIDARGVSAGRVLGDATQLTLLVRNLVENARRHARSRVVVGLGASAGDVVLTVDDDGRGVPEADRERVFDRFVRLDDARTRDDGGTGLGLAIVREVARAHGGDVRVEAAPSGGARFVCRLPAPPTPSA